MKKILLVLCLVLGLVSPVLATNNRVQGTITTPNTSVVMADATISLQLSQAGVDVSNSYAVVPTLVQCYTSAAGAVVGLRDPLVKPVLNAVNMAGSVVANTYYIKIAYWSGSVTSAPSPESSVVVASPNNAVTVAAPLFQPSEASGYKVYVSASTGTETLRATVTGWSPYTLTSLSAGGALPTNTSQCLLTFNDQIIPTGTVYHTTMTNLAGQTVPGFPQDWYLAGSSVNVGTGYPLASVTNRTRFYSPVLQNPSSEALQSINSPLDLNGHDLTGVGTLTAAALDLSTINNIRYCDQFAGATAGAKLVACIADLPSTGGTADARGFAGPQTISTNIWSGVTKPVLLLTSAGAQFTVTVTQRISCSNCTWDLGGTILKFDPMDATMSGQDRLMVVGVKDSDIDIQTNVTAPIAVGATSFVVTSSTGVNVGDWGTISELEPAVGDLAAFDYVQVSGIAGTTISVYTPFRTAFPSTHSTPVFSRVSNMTKNVTVRNGGCVTLDSVHATPCFQIFTSIGTVFDNLVASPVKGNPFYTYRAKAGKLVNSRATSVRSQTSEFAESVDMVVANNVFECEDAAANTLGAVLDYGFAWFAVTGNHFSCGGNFLFAAWYGVHDGVISSNTFSSGIDAGIGSVNGLSYLGMQRVNFVDNVLIGKGTGVGINGGPTTGWTANITSTGNNILNNVVTNFTTPYGSPLVGDTYLRTTATAGRLNATNGLTLGVAQNDNTSVLLTLEKTTLVPIETATITGVSNEYRVFEVSGGKSRECFGFNDIAQRDLCVDQDALLLVNNSTSAGGLKLGASGTPIRQHLSATASLDFAAWAGNDCQDLTITVTGAVDGDTVEIGVPLALSSTANVMFTGTVSGANTVTVRGCKFTAGASANPAAATVRADVWHH